MMRMAGELFHVRRAFSNVAQAGRGWAGRGMFQLINGAIECGQCRREIRHGDEFVCCSCGASLCEGCLLDHEQECEISLEAAPGPARRLL